LRLPIFLDPRKFLSQPTPVFYRSTCGIGKLSNDWLKISKPVCRESFNLLRCLV
jgi:hypothetical protein